MHIVKAIRPSRDTTLAKWLAELCGDADKNGEKPKLAPVGVDV
jgi:hypothetical protein